MKKKHAITLISYDLSMTNLQKTDVFQQKVQ